MEHFEYIKRFLKIIFRLNKMKLLVSFLIMAIISSFELCLPQILKLILDNAILNNNINLLIKLVVIYISVITIVALLSIIIEYLYSVMKKKVSIKLKISLLKHLTKLSGAYYSNIKTGNILSIVENDIFILESFGAELLFSVISNFITAIVSLFFLANMQFDLLCIVVLLQIFLIYFQSKVAKIITLKTNEIRNGYGDIYNIVQEFIYNIMNVVISKYSFQFFKKYIKKEKDIISKCVSLDVIISSNIYISRFLTNIMTIFIYGYGGIKIIKGEMSIGNLIAFQQYTGMLIGPCINIIKSNTTLHQSLISLKRIFSILDEPITIKTYYNGKLMDKHNNEDIVFKDVKFSYGKLKVLKGINIKFKKGNITAIVGPSGCGKSTIVNLLFRLWDVDEGNIIIGNEDIKNYNLKSLRKNISVITQELLIIDDSIFNNLTLGNKRISKSYLEDICKKVDIYSYIETLPNKFDTIIGENGVKLSGGQKQKIAIVRSLINDSNILIFDEATSALDNISQRNILKNIKEYLYNKTVIVIAHRLSSIKDADEIYVINDGIVVEKGLHNELLMNKNLYYNLTNEQVEESIKV